eukprot:15345678-Ditylum_brightwellii.AAC.1
MRLLALLSLTTTPFIKPSLCFSIKTPTSSKTSLPIITASPENADITFDSGCVANPVILLPSPQNNQKWQCFYYGNSGSWANSIPCFLPTGSSGLAESPDGLTGWTKIAGPCAEGACLTPGSSGSWDAVQTGVGDVIRVGDELHMYYFGGSEEALPMGPGGSIVGFRMRIGRARSYDNGRSWKKDETYLLDYDETEGFFASWPRIIVSEDDETPWKMFYHSFNGQKWSVYGAESVDKGDTWSRTGLVLEGDTSNEDAFDYAGIGTRAIAPWRNGLLMIYEGVAKSGKHSLGAAFCDDNKTWKKLNDAKPILEPGKGPLGDWTNQVIGTPYLVVMDDGSLRLYHCGKEGAQAKMSIGVVVSKSGDVEPDCWTAL